MYFLFLKGYSAEKEREKRVWKQNFKNMKTNEQKQKPKKYYLGDLTVNTSHHFNR